MKKLVFLSLLSLLSFNFISAEQPNTDQLHERLVDAQELLNKRNPQDSDYKWIQGYICALTYAIYGDM